jgi:hypothetical protein
MPGFNQVCGMASEIMLDRDMADKLIGDGENLLYIEVLKSQYLTCRTKYNREFTDKCHVIPSWQWDKKGGFFRVHYLDMPVLESLAFKNEYEVKYGPGVVEHLKQVRDLYLTRREWKKEPFVEIPVTRKMRDYQIIGSQFMFKTRRVLNADGMGCLSGDTEVVINRGGNGRRYKLRDAYERFNGKAARKSDNWELPSFTRSLMHGHLGLNRIEGIIYKGKLPVKRIVTESGKSIVATPDHKFITPSGKVTVERLSVGDELLVNGNKLCSMCGAVGPTSRRKLRDVCRSCAYRKKRSYPNKGTGELLDEDGYVRVTAGIKHHPSYGTHGIYKHRLVFEAVINGMPYSDYAKKLRGGDLAGLRDSPSRGR